MEGGYFFILTPNRNPIKSTATANTKIVFIILSPPFPTNKQKLEGANRLPPKVASCCKYTHYLNENMREWQNRAKIHNIL